MALSTKTYKGARDFYPEDKCIQKYIFSVWREAAESFGYQEYDAPLIESVDIYRAKTSEEIVNEQTYQFVDRGGRQVTIRPEMTPTVSRMVAARRQELSYPLRWYSIPNLWRYERPQKGRLREHWQLNVDLFGVAGIDGDIELIQLADTIMQKFGATRDSYVIRINSRKLINTLLNDYLSLDADLVPQVIRLIDRMHKLPELSFFSEMKELIGDNAGPLVKLLQSSQLNNLPDVIKNVPYISDLHKLELFLARVGITNARFDITLMRGFDYYTDIVFEIYDTNPDNNRSMFGGGRYDGLVGLFGVEPVPTVGFGMGDLTILEFLKLHSLLPKLNNTEGLRAILIGDVFEASQSVIQQLRLAGINTAVDSTDRKLDNRIKSAVKSGVKFVMFIGESELASHRFSIKNLESGEEAELDVLGVINQIKSSN